MYKSKFADRISELELRIPLMELWDFNIKLMSKEYSKLLKHLQLHKANAFQLKRIGSENDGGYVLVDSFDEIDFVVSLGVGNNVDCELYFANMNKTVYLFDGTIDVLPKSHRNFVFEPANVYGAKTEFKTNIQGVRINETLSQLMETADPVHKVRKCIKPNSILMMDIEGSEYEVVLDMKSEYLKKFQQVSIEFHDVHREVRGKQKRLENCLRKLGKTHMLIAAHGNNYGGYLTYLNQDYPDVIELTWLNKSLGPYSKIPNSFASIGNRPNNPRKRELNLEW